MIGYLFQMIRSIYIGFEPREAAAFMVAVSSTTQRLSKSISVKGLELTDLQNKGLYTRPTEVRNGKLYDVISEHEMSTEFACSRFLVPYLAKTGWALFVDCDMLVLADLVNLFALADDRYAVMCVKHDHRPLGTIKMDGQVQASYSRKNWSSVCLFNCDHPSNKKKLTLELINSVPGRDLHAFCWLKDEEIGELPLEYNFLVGYSAYEEVASLIKIVHFTEGTPDMVGYENCHYADLWRLELRRAAHIIF